MLATFIIDPPFLIFLGFLFAWGLSPRGFWAGIVTLTLFNVGVALSYVWYPDWMWMYYRSDVALPVANRIGVLVFFLALYYAIYGFGFWLAHRWHVISKRRHLIGTFVWLTASGLVILPFFSRYFAVGTEADFLGGTTIPLPQSPLGTVYNILMPVVILAGLALFLWSRKRS